MTAVPAVVGAVARRVVVTGAIGIVDAVRAGPALARCVGGKDGARERADAEDRDLEGHGVGAVAQRLLLDDARAADERADVCADGVVRDHHVLHGGGGVDIDAANLLGELAIGVGDGSTARECACLCRTDGVDRRNPRALGADAPAVPVRRCLGRGQREHCEREHKHAGNNGFYKVHKPSSLYVCF